MLTIEVAVLKEAMEVINRSLLSNESVSQYTWFKIEKNKPVVIMAFNKHVSTRVITSVYSMCSNNIIFGMETCTLNKFIKKLKEGNVKIDYIGNKLITDKMDKHCKSWITELDTNTGNLINERFACVTDTVSCEDVNRAVLTGEDKFVKWFEASKALSKQSTMLIEEHHSMVRVVGTDTVMLFVKDTDSMTISDKLLRFVIEWEALEQVKKLFASTGIKKQDVNILQWEYYVKECDRDYEVSHIEMIIPMVYNNINIRVNHRRGDAFPDYRKLIDNIDYDEIKLNCEDIIEGISMLDADNKSLTFVKDIGSGKLTLNSFIQELCTVTSIVGDREEMTFKYWLDKYRISHGKVDVVWKMLSFNHKMLANVMKQFKTKSKDFDVKMISKSCIHACYFESLDMNNKLLFLLMPSRIRGMK